MASPGSGLQETLHALVEQVNMCLMVSFDMWVSSIWHDDEPIVHTLIIYLISLISYLNIELVPVLVLSLQLPQGISTFGWQLGM